MHPFDRHIKVTQKSGHQVYGHSPTRDDRNASFSANIETGLWTDHGTGDSGNWSQFCKLLGIKDEITIPRGPNNTTVFEYENELGEIVLQVHRTPNKDIFMKSQGSTGWINKGYKKNRPASLSIS